MRDGAASGRARQLRDRAVAGRIAETGLHRLPAVACLPPPVATLLEADESYYTERNLLALRNTRLANLLGLAAITLPLPGPPDDGLMLFGPEGRGRGRALAAAGARADRWPAERFDPGPPLFVRPVAGPAPGG